MSYPSYDKTFNAFQDLNARRCREAFDPGLHSVEFFAIAIAGETGEMCNKIKKALRGDFSMQSIIPDLLAELADIITYSDLMITKLGGNTEQELYKKFREVSQRRQWEE